MKKIQIFTKKKETRKDNYRKDKNTKKIRTVNKKLSLLKI